MTMRKILTCFAAVFMACCFFLKADAAVSDRTAVFYFTHDIHSYLDSEEGTPSRGARLSAALKENGYYEDGNALYLDAGDFSQGTLFQAGYEEEAFELRFLGKLGATAATPGNHEWDHGGTGFANMLQSALNSGENLPSMLLSNLDFSGELTEEQKEVRDALLSYAKSQGQEDYRYQIFTLENGLKVGIFAVSGEDSISDSPTSGMNWINFIDAAKEVVKELRPECDILVCLSHTGTDSAEKGEDIELAKAVPEIDFIVSGHSHSLYPEGVVIGQTVLGSTGEYLANLGKAVFTVSGDGKVSLSGYQLIPIDDKITDDPEITEYLEEQKEWITENYLGDYGLGFDTVICESSYDMLSLSGMYGTHDEYPMGDLIADSYLYEAQKYGIDDIDLAIVGLGTIRGSVKKGPITVSDAFEMCSLGMGSDRSAGHPISYCYVTGKEIKLLMELDASLGPFVNSIKMSYSGNGPLEGSRGTMYRFNEKRMLLDRVTESYLYRDGELSEIEDDKLYKVCFNMYAGNMLGMLNGLTKGILSITPKYADGTPIDDFYDTVLKRPDGSEIKEWVAFSEYLASFPDTDGNGIPNLSAAYEAPLGRKVKYAEGGLSVLKNPGITTLSVCAAAVLILLIVFLVVKKIKKKVNKK